MKANARQAVLVATAAVLLAACSVGVALTDPPGPSGPPDGRPTFVIPRPGRLGVHPVGATKLEAQVDGPRVRVSVP